MIKVCDYLLGYLNPMDQEIINHIGFSGYVSEYRTIGLRLPRQSGKTRYLVNMQGKKSSIMFVQSNVQARSIDDKIYNRQVFGVCEIENVAMSIRGMSPYGMKYQCILLDECLDVYETEQFRTSFSIFLDTLYRKDMVADDFFVMSLGT